MTVIGLDLSLASTGVASSEGWVDRIHTKPDGHLFRRLRQIRREVTDYIHEEVRLVVVEGLAVHSQTGQHLTRAGLWHMVMEAVDLLGVPWIEVPPTVVKKYATGKGNAPKDEVLAAAVRRFPDAFDIKGNDEADALWLVAIGTDLLGEPVLNMPDVNRSALVKLRVEE